MKKEFRHAGLAMIMLISGAFMATSCSSDEPDNTKPTDPEVEYKGNVAYSNGILFNGGKEIGRSEERRVGKEC